MDHNAPIKDHKLSDRHQADDDDDTIDLLQIWSILWQRKWSLISLTVVMMILAALVALSMEPIYSARSTLQIDNKSANVVSIEQIYGLDNEGSEYLQTQFELLRSRSLAERVVRGLDLTNHPLFDPAQQPEKFVDLGKIKALLDFRKYIPALAAAVPALDAASAEERKFDAVVRHLMSTISVSQQGKSRLVTIGVEVPDARLAARIANALADGYIENQLEASLDMSATATGWMTGRLADLREGLKHAESRLQEFRESEQLVDVDGVASIAAGELATTGERMVDARRQRAEAESQYRQVQAMQHEGWERLATIPSVLGHPLIQGLKTEQARSRAQVEELSRRYGPRHPSMIAAQSELAAATASLSAQIEQIVAGIERRYQLAVANEQSLMDSIESYKHQIQDISRKEFRLRELQRDVETNRTLYDTFMTRLKETAATADIGTVNARVVDRATVPINPVKPRKSLIVALAGLLTLILASALALLLDALNNTFKSPEDVESQLNLPVLGIVPMVAEKFQPELVRMFSSGENKGFSESIRTIRTAVMLTGVNHLQKLVLVTSSLPGEGKSTVASNLAIALGQMERVLLVDADLRRPTLAKRLHYPAGTPGLANLIAGTAPLEDCVRHEDGIDVICAGSVPPNPLELLLSSRFEELLIALKDRYDRIVIDSPPLHAVSDAVVLATHADALIYVVKSESTQIPLVEKSIGQLLQNNAPVTGVVMNQVDISKGQRYGYGYAGYYDYYGYSSDGDSAPVRA